MASGSFSSSTGVNCNVRVSYWSSTNTATNASTITMTAYLDYYAPLYMSSRTLTFNCDGQTNNVTFTVPSGGSGRKSVTLGEWTTDVTHDDNGTKSCYIGVSTPLNVTYSGKYLGTISAGGNVTLDTIPRKSTITAIGNFNVENEHWLVFTQNSSSFWHKLWIQARKSGTSNAFETVGVFEDYHSEQHVRFNPENVAQIYKMAMPDTYVGNYVDVLYHLETWTAQHGGVYVGEDVRTVRGYINGNIFTNVDGTWKKCVPFINVNGAWKPCVCYENVNKTWKRTYIYEGPII